MIYDERCKSEYENRDGLAAGDDPRRFQGTRICEGTGDILDEKPDCTDESVRVAAEEQEAVPINQKGSNVDRSNVG